MQLFYDKNKVTSTRGVIFVSTKVKSPLSHLEGEERKDKLTELLIADLNKSMKDAIVNIMKGKTD